MGARRVPRTHWLPGRLPLGPSQRWIERRLRGRVVRVTRLSGGVVGVVQRVDVDTRRGRRTVVLRRFPPGTPARRPATEVRREVRALDELPARGLRRGVPRLLAADPTGADAGLPAVLQTCLPGHPVLVPTDRRAWADRLAAHLVDRTERGLDARRLPRARDWVMDPAPVPPGSRRPELWHAVYAAAAEPRAGTGRVLLHRDLHPGNVLWRRGEITGVVDWVHLCAGPVEVDVSRCRVVSAVVGGTRAADRILAGCAPLLPDGYDPRWDLLVCAELGPFSIAMAAYNDLGLHLTRRRILDRLEAVAERALADLGRPPDR